MAGNSQRRRPSKRDRKASNLGSRRDKDIPEISVFPITTFTVGNWKRESTHEGNLNAVFFYTSKKVEWDFIDGSLNSKMRVSWSDITAIEALMNPNQPGILRIQLAKPPLFFQEIPPSPRHHPNWKKANDFTNGQALIYPTHEATFPPGALDEHYAKLLIKDERLAELSRKPFPPVESVSSVSSNAVIGNQINNNEPTFVDSSGLNRALVVPDQRLHHYNNNEPAFFDGSSSEAQYLEQNCAADVDDEALAEALAREADAACDDDLWSMIDEYMKQTDQEDHGNELVGCGNVNEASSSDPPASSPPSKP
ncbi:uncharacterized protein LOC121795214 [Salvia splendens]|uniref:uncharacterized protein LOC121795214 n=1 Tax=Salvia splendens TaxID=180675 RepID=UPI001C264127|nr:uncharacterized protein LOC121795214 [Salvia splendens]